MSSSLTITSSNRFSTLSSAASPLLLLFLALISHGIGLANGFVWDDRTVFLNSQAVLSPDGWGAIWSGRGIPDYVPLTWSVIKLGHLAFGDWAAGLHAVNLALHAANTLLLWRLLVVMRVPGAFWGAAFFAVHPIHVASVDWISEIKNTLSLFLALGASLSFFSPPKRGRWVSAPLFALALLAKASVVTLPLGWGVILLWRYRARTSQALLRILPYLIISAAAGSIALWFQIHGAIHGEFAANSLRTGAKLMRALWAVGFDLRQIVWPVNLSMLYASRNPGDGHWGPWIVLILAVATTITALTHLGRPIARGWVAGFSIFLILLVPVLGFLPMYYQRLAPVADQWLYLPSLPIFAMAGAFFATFGSDARGRIFLSLCLIVLGWLSFRQIPHLYDNVTLWQSVMKTDPCWYAAMNLSCAEEEPSQVERDARLALTLGPHEPETVLNLSKILSILGKNKEALETISRGCVQFPNVGEMFLIQGKIFARDNRLDEAMKNFRQAWKINPSDDESLICDAMTRLSNQDPIGAIDPLCRYLERHPEDAERWDLVGQALANSGHQDGAIKAFTKAASLQPGNEVFEAHLQEIHNGDVSRTLLLPKPLTTDPNGH